MTLSDEEERCITDEMSKWLEGVMNRNGLLVSKGEKPQDGIAFVHAIYRNWSILQAMKESMQKVSGRDVSRC